MLNLELARDVLPDGSIAIVKYDACPHCRQPYGDTVLAYGGIRAAGGPEAALEYLAADFPAPGPGPAC